MAKAKTALEICQNENQFRVAIKEGADENLQESIELPYHDIETAKRTRVFSLLQRLFR